jgi:cytochrome d ubiquinol oxidase subunit I
VFWSFRIMVGIGMLMIATGLIALVLFFRKRLFDTAWFQYWCMALTPAGFIAVLAGWFVTEIGRQPYIVYGLLKTADAVSPVSAGPIAISLLAFIVVYVLVFGAGSYYILKLIAKGPGIQEPIYGDHGVATPPIVATIGERGPQHV